MGEKPVLNLPGICQEFLTFQVFEKRKEGDCVGSTSSGAHWSVSGGCWACNREKHSNTLHNGKGKPCDHNVSSPGVIAARTSSFMWLEDPEGFLAHGGGGSAEVEYSAS